MKEDRDKTRTPILAAGGIVLRHDGKPVIAVVQLRKMSQWVLPKGKLAVGESTIAAARREVLEETGYRVSIREYVGALAYETGGRHKIVHFWRMQALAGPVRELMRDVKAMEWLALDEAIERLSHVREQAFLREVGPLAVRHARPPRKRIIRIPLAVPAPLPQAVPEQVAPVDFAAPLPVERIARIAIAESRASGPAVASETRLENPIESNPTAASLPEASPIEQAPIEQGLIEVAPFEKNRLERSVLETTPIKNTLLKKTLDLFRPAARQSKSSHS